MTWRCGKLTSSIWINISMHYETWRWRIFSLGNKNMVRRQITSRTRNFTRWNYNLWNGILCLFKKKKQKTLLHKKHCILHILSSSEKHIFWAAHFEWLKIRQIQSNNCNEWQKMLTAFKNIYEMSPGFSISTNFHPLLHSVNTSTNAIKGSFVSLQFLQC